MSEWISVDDDMPETFETDGNYHASKECLVLCAGNYELGLFQYGPDSGGWHNWYSHFYEDTFDGVTHWMPLPPLPKGEDQ
jgi:hypothetical protein